MSLSLFRSLRESPSGATPLVATEHPSPPAAALVHPANATLEHAEDRLRARAVYEATALFFRAEAEGADRDRCAAGRWTAAMLAGDFEAAWQESDALRRRAAPDPHRFWQGEDITGKRVILRCLHGLGDAVQFLRFAPLLAQRAAQLIVEVPPAFEDLARCFAGIDNMITWGQHAPADPPDFDVQVEINEVAYMLRVQPDDLPGAAHYLRLRPSWMRGVHAQSRRTSALRVGVVWSSGTWNTQRSVPWPIFRQIFSTPGCEFWNLQGGDARAQWHDLYASPALSGNLHDAAECADSVPLLSALIAQLDVVLTTDTLAAHLAGALGTPALLLLAHEADWRWQIDRADSPWYPSLRLLRQPRAGEWDSVVQAAAAALESQQQGRTRERERGAA